MLIRGADELLTRGKFDITRDDTVTAYTVYPEKIENGLVVWKELKQAKVSRGQLHYDDTADGSNKYLKSWQNFYAGEKVLGEAILYSGSSNMFSKGRPSFGGVGKAAIYLRYSKGFLDWLSGFDLDAAAEIRAQVPDFETILLNQKKKNLPQVWQKFQTNKECWTLPVVAALSNKKHIVWGLSGTLENNWNALKDMNIDIPRSLELMSFMTIPEVVGAEVISGELQTGAGLGRNAFASKTAGANLSEYTRLLGAKPKNSRNKILEVLANKLSYRIKVAPNPDTSEMIFLPEGDLPFSTLKQFVDYQNEQVKLFYEVKKKKKEKGVNNDDAESTVIKSPALLPTHEKATIYLVNVEGSQKKKIVVLQVFPSVTLNYIETLNNELLNNTTQFILTNYMKQALTGGATDTAANYRYWTTVFTKALQKQYISAEEVFASFQRFAKTQSGEELIKNRRAADYFRVIGKMRRLQHIIDLARSSEDSLKRRGLSGELNSVENFELTNKGVFATMPNTESACQLLGSDVYELLRDGQKKKIDVFTSLASSGVPNKDFATFIKGALTGMLLNELTFIVTQAGRSFSLTQGRHPSRLRGNEIVKIFDDGLGMLINLKEEVRINTDLPAHVETPMVRQSVANRFNTALLPTIVSYTDISRKDVFNSGLIMGLVFYIKSNNEKEEKES